MRYGKTEKENGYKKLAIEKIYVRICKAAYALAQSHIKVFIHI